MSILGISTRGKFKWYSENIFPLSQRMTAAERQYVERCFQLMRGIIERPGIPENLSQYTFSIRIDGERVNASRFAVGSLDDPTLTYQAAAPVLAERELDPYQLFPDFAPDQFYGLGWDFDQQHFKIYLAVSELELYRPQFPELFVSKPDGSHAGGLISKTFIGGELFESKVYFYPAIYDDDNLSSAQMSTSNRGAIEQPNVEEQEDWLPLISKVGVELVERCNRARILWLDTINFTDRDHYTMYLD